MQIYFKSIIAALLSLILIGLTGCQNLPGSNPMAGGNIFNPSANSNNLAASVQAAFDNDPVLTGVPIKIEAQNDTVHLSGYVKTIRQSDTAAMLASRVNGVKVVDNSLIVRK
jgi:osmotically-inducible protein OsmY